MASKKTNKRKLPEIESDPANSLELSDSNIDCDYSHEDDTNAVDQPSKKKRLNKLSRIQQMKQRVSQKYPKKASTMNDILDEQLPCMNNDNNKVAEECEIVSESITCNLNMRIHRNVMMFNNRQQFSKNNQFYVELRSSVNELFVVGEFDPCTTRNLRPKPELKSMKPKKPLTSMTKYSKPLATLINTAWKKCKSKQIESSHKISIDDIVMAKVSGYSAWPAIILEFVNKNRAKVEFFGTEPHEKFGLVDVKEITLFENSADVIIPLLKRNARNFKKATKEAEISCGVPELHSLCKIV